MLRRDTLLLFPHFFLNFFPRKLLYSVEIKTIQNCYDIKVVLFVYFRVRWYSRCHQNLLPGYSNMLFDVTYDYQITQGTVKILNNNKDYQAPITYLINILNCTTQVNCNPRMNQQSRHQFRKFIGI